MSYFIVFQRPKSFVKIKGWLNGIKLQGNSDIKEKSQCSVEKCMVVLSSNI